MPIPALHPPRRSRGISRPTPAPRSLRDTQAYMISIDLQGFSPRGRPSFKSERTKNSYVQLCPCLVDHHSPTPYDPVTTSNSAPLSVVAEIAPPVKQLVAVRLTPVANDASGPNVPASRLASCTLPEPYASPMPAKHPPAAAYRSPKIPCPVGSVLLMGLSR